MALMGIVLLIFAQVVKLLVPLAQAGAVLNAFHVRFLFIFKLFQTNAFQLAI